MNSARFTIENSGNYNRIPCPYQLGGDGIEVWSETYREWKPIGYTLNPPMDTSWKKYVDDCDGVVGIMFENTRGHKYWFHFPYSKIED